MVEEDIIAGQCYGVGNGRLLILSVQQPVTLAHATRGRDPPVVRIKVRQSPAIFIACPIRNYAAKVAPDIDDDFMKIARRRGREECEERDGSFGSNLMTVTAQRTIATRPARLTT